eukprot:3450997-Lingulodinium_polyedra.AAC.1
MPATASHSHSSSYPKLLMPATAILTAAALKSGSMNTMPPSTDSHCCIAEPIHCSIPKSSSGAPSPTGRPFSQAPAPMAT